jgi:hypothetical protein
MNHRNTSDFQENTQRKSSNRLATAALIFSLLMTPAIENWNATVSAQDTSKSTQTEQVEPTKHVNTMSTEQIIKKSVKETFVWVKSLKELPRKMIYTWVDAKNLPQSFDIEPKEITAPIPFITVTLWTRSFTLSPSLGKITGVELTEHDLILKTTFKNMKYNRHEKLPALFRMLRNTPRGKWEKDGFLLTTVVEV